MVSEVKFPPYVRLRGKVFWFRRRVEDGLIPIIGRGEFNESLKTSDLAEARKLAAFRNAELEAEFERARAVRKAQTTTVPLHQQPTTEEGQYIREAVRSYLLEEDEAVRMSVPDDDAMEAYEDIRADENEAVVEGLRSGAVALGPVEKERMRKLLAAIGVTVEPGSPGWHMAAYRATEGLLLGLRDIGSRINGGFVVTPPRPVAPASLAAPSPEVSASSSPVVTLGDVIDHYVKGLPDNDFKRKVKRCLQLFGEMLGRNLPVADLRQKAVTDFMRDICRLPDKWARRFDAGESIASMLAVKAEKVMSPTTYEANYRGPLGTFLDVSSRTFGDDGFRAMSVKHIKYMGDRLPEEDQQRALRLDELVTLFEGDAFARIAQDPKQEPLYWLFVVMLFTGARPREVCQLNPQVDFGQVDEVWYIDLDEKTPAGVGVKKSIKTGEARRVPLHAELVRLGFAEYLQQAKERGADRLFPTWRLKNGNTFSAHYKAVADLLRAVGLYTRDAPPGEQITGAYTLRKTFITECRNQGVVSKELTGHSDGSTTAMQDRHYIFGPEPFRRKLEQLSKLAMPVRIPVRR